jgi:hypothetical protein
MMEMISQCNAVPTSVSAEERPSLVFPYKDMEAAVSVRRQKFDIPFGFKH